MNWSYSTEVCHSYYSLSCTSWKTEMHDKIVSENTLAEKVTEECVKTKWYVRKLQKYMWRPSAGWKWHMWMWMWMWTLTQHWTAKCWVWVKHEVPRCLCNSDTIWDKWLNHIVSHERQQKGALFMSLIRYEGDDSTISLLLIITYRHCTYLPLLYTKLGNLG
jgi:hypothetical protein